MKLSPSSCNLYLSCQRKYWHEKVDKTRPDLDYCTPGYFAFGRAFAQCHDAYGPSYTLDAVKSVASLYALDVNAVARLQAMIAKYYASFEAGQIIEKEKTLEHEFISGRVDKVAIVRGKRYIVEDKTASEINVALETTLLIDTQLCLYAACRSQFDADGILYRVVTKPREKRKKEEPFDAYRDRCTCEAREIELPFNKLHWGPAIDRIVHVIGEISQKKEKEQFAINPKMCVQFGSACAYYSACHEKTYSEAKGVW